MKRFVEGEDRRQSLLLPESLDDYVTEDNPVRVALGHAAIGMAAEDDVRRVLEPDLAGDVVDVGRKIDARDEQVRAFAHARQGGRNDDVTQGRQPGANLIPAPAAVPGAMDEQE
ncbi:MAG TPA: hypothetical protein VFE10_08335, partial [Phenylobacterium sp.]|nr:hypothetical protein [Phenylobacterium sp.]